ncbi:hypothetical protein ABK046_49420, partial [Streptomyces caeruleatus]
LLGGVAIIGLSLAAARLMTLLIDDPVRTWRRDREGVITPVAVVVASAIVVVFPLTLWQGAVERREQAVADRAVVMNPGAAVLW